MGRLFNWVRSKVEAAIDWVQDKLGKKSYSSSSIEDQIDVDKALAEFRDSIKKDVSNSEMRCMNSISTVFMNLKNQTNKMFPDLVEIIDSEQKKAERELSGSVMKYVKEHLSKNDEEFLKVLKMQPGQAKTAALGLESDSVIENAEKLFNAKLKQYAEHILNEFTSRLEERIDNQEQQMKRNLERLEKLEDEAKKGKIDVDSLIDSCAPIMESAKCITSILGMEV